MLEEQHAESVPDSAESCSRCSDINRRLCISTVVPEVDDGFVALYVSLSKEVSVMKGNKQIPFRLITRRGREREGERRGERREEKRGEEKEIRETAQRWKPELSFFIPPLSFCCDSTGKTLSSIPVFVYVCSIHLMLVYCPSHARSQGWPIHLQEADLRTSFTSTFCGYEKHQPGNFVPTCSLKDEVVVLCVHHECLDCVLRER